MPSNVGDDINGGSGTDTLNLVDAVGTAAGFSTLNSVETVNVRTLVGSATDTTDINAAGWSGVATLTNASSLADSQLNVTGLSIATDVKLYGNTDMDIGYSITATGGSATVTLVAAGNGNTATTIGSASAAATANLDIDIADAGLITSVAIEVQGTNLARIEAGSNATTYTISGTGNAALVSDDNITSFDASAAAGNIDMTFSGASDVVAVGGAGNDTFRFGTTFSNSDTINGGSGNDTVTLTISGFTRTLNASNVETAGVTFNDDLGGAVNVTSSSITTFNLGANSAGADGTLNNIANAATVNLGASADAFGLVTLDAASGAQTLTINAGTASGAMAFDLTVTDAANVTLNNVLGTSTNAGTLTIATATFDSDTKSIAINAVTGSGAIAFTDLLVGGATAVTITSNASGGITLGTGISGSALSVVSLVANGSADIAGETIEGTGLTSITLDANGGGNIFLADTGSGIELGNGTTGALATVTVNLNAETNSDVGTAAAGASGILVNTTGAIALTVNINAPSASGGVHLGIIDVELGDASAATTNTIINISAGTVASNSIIRTETINVNAMTGTQVSIGAVSLGASATFVLASGGIDATDVDNVDVTDLNLTLAASAIAAVGAITTTGGMVNSITLSAADGASATFGAIRASGVGAISLTIGSGASANFGDIAVSASGSIGSIEIAGSDTGGVTFGSLSASAVGSIAISGALDVTFGTITATRVGSINSANQGTGGAFTIDLSGVTNAVEGVLGAATNTIISGAGNDVFTLKTGSTGNDNIRYSTATQGTDNIINFGVGTTGTDDIEFVLASYGATGGLQDASGSARATVDLSALITAAATLAADDNIIVLGTAFDPNASALGFLTSGITFLTALAGEASFLVVYGTGADTVVASLRVATSTSLTTLASGSASLTLNQVAIISGVTPAAFVAGNFEIV